MTNTELIAYLTEGLDDEQAKAVRDAFKNQKVAERAGTLKAAKEYDDLAAREAALQSELKGGPDKPGALAYQNWYAEYYPKVQQLMTERQQLIEKYGTVAQPKGAAPVDPNPPAPGTLTEADIRRISAEAADQRIREGYSPRWGHLITGMGAVIQKHVFAGRKKPIDMGEFNKLAEKYQTAEGNPDLDRAYEEYDKPERDLQAKADQEKLINQRVNEELQKRGAHANFPAGADATPGILSRDRDSSKFDKAAMERDLVNTFISGEEGGGKLTGFGVN